MAKQSQKSSTRREYEEEVNSIARRGQGGIPPCRVKGRRPLWGLGQRPNRCLSKLLKGNSQQGAGSEASLPVTMRSRRSAPQAALSLNAILSRQMGATTMLDFQP